jgi:hypothetical protein
LVVKETPLEKTGSQPKQDSTNNGNWHINDAMESGTVYYWAYVTDSLIPERQFYIAGNETIKADFSYNFVIPC